MVRRVALLSSHGGRPSLLPQGLVLFAILPLLSLAFSFLNLSSNSCTGQTRHCIMKSKCLSHLRPSGFSPGTDNVKSFLPTIQENFQAYASTLPYFKEMNERRPCPQCCTLLLSFQNLKNLSIIST